MRRMFSLKQLQEIADSEVKSLVEGGTLENAKPLYFHPLSVLYGSGGNYPYMITLIIINNDSTPIDSWSKLLAIFDNIYDTLPEGVTTARFPASGYFQSATQVLVMSAIEITGKTDATRLFTGMRLSDQTVANANFSTIEAGKTPRVFDGVNKIN